MAAARQNEMNDSMTVVATTTLVAVEPEGLAFTFDVLKKLLLFRLPCGTSLSNWPAGLADGLELESTLSFQDYAPVTVGPPLQCEESHTEFGTSQISMLDVNSEDLAHSHNYAGCAAAGHAAYLVGGCVRDLLLASSSEGLRRRYIGPTGRVAAALSAGRSGGRAFRRGAGSRGRGARGGRDLPQRSGIPGRAAPGSSAFRNGSARRTSLRRDFTINALLLDPDTGEVLDFVGGQADLKAGVIRAIGDPERRFQEDHLRLLRAVRFAARLNFTIEARTFGAMQAAGASDPKRFGGAGAR